MKYKLDKYIEDIFVNPYEDSPQEMMEALNNKDIKHYRMKTIRSGKMLESEIYPIWNTCKKQIKDKVKDDKRINRKYNAHKYISKKIVRLVNGNFTDKDIWITVGYRNNIEPNSLAKAKRDVVNYIRKLQRYCKKMNYPPLKYLYVTEGGEGKRFHHHIILNFPDRDIAEKKWTKGAYSQARRLQPVDYGLEGLARYISKQVKAAVPSINKETGEITGKPKSYGYSLNLYKPWEHATIADSRITRTRARHIATNMIEPRDCFEKMYKDYRFKDMEVLFNDYVSGCYIYTRMHRND